MTELQQEILEELLPEYASVKKEIESYSNYELNLIKHKRVERIGDLRDKIITELQWEIVNNLFSPFISDWDTFYFEYEQMLEDYCYDCTFIEYDEYNNCYKISEEDVIEICKDIIDKINGEHSMNKEVDFNSIINSLNGTFPFKFSKV